MKQRLPEVDWTSQSKQEAADVMMSELTCREGWARWCLWWFSRSQPSAPGNQSRCLWVFCTCLIGEGEGGTPAELHSAPLLPPWRLTARAARCPLQPSGCQTRPAAEVLNSGLPLKPNGTDEGNEYQWGCWQGQRSASVCPSVLINEEDRNKPCLQAAGSERPAAPCGCVWIYVSAQVWAGGPTRVRTTRTMRARPRPQRPAAVWSGSWENHNMHEEQPFPPHQPSSQPPYVFRKLAGCSRAEPSMITDNIFVLHFNTHILILLFWNVLLSNVKSGVSDLRWPMTIILSLSPRSCISWIWTKVPTE